MYKALKNLKKFNLMSASIGLLSPIFYMPLGAFSAQSVPVPQPSLKVVFQLPSKWKNLGSFEEAEDLCSFSIHQYLSSRGTFLGMSLPIPTFDPLLAIKNHYSSAECKFYYEGQKPLDTHLHTWVVGEGNTVIRVGLEAPSIVENPNSSRVLRANMKNVYVAYPQGEHVRWRPLTQSRGFLGKNPQGGLPLMHRPLTWTFGSHVQSQESLANSIRLASDISLFSLAVWYASMKPDDFTRLSGVIMMATPLALRAASSFTGTQTTPPLESSFQYLGQSAQEGLSAYGTIFREQLSNELSELRENFEALSQNGDHLDEESTEKMANISCRIQAIEDKLLDLGSSPKSALFPSRSRDLWASAPSSPKPSPFDLRGSRYETREAPALEMNSTLGFLGPAFLQMLSKDLNFNEFWQTVNSIRPAPKTANSHCPIEKSGSGDNSSLDTAFSDLEADWYGLPALP